jgi:hypothetical protein
MPLPKYRPRIVHQTQNCKQVLQKSHLEDSLKIKETNCRIESFKDSKSNFVMKIGVISKPTILDQIINYRKLGNIVGKSSMTCCLHSLTEICSNINAQNNSTNNYQYQV